MFYMVLDDGETYSGIYGCRIIQLPDLFTPDQIEDALDEIRHSDEEFIRKHVVTEFR